MAKLTTEIIEDLYKYGKEVHQKAVGIDDAVDLVLKKFQD